MGLRNRGIRYGAARATRVRAVYFLCALLLGLMAAATRPSPAAAQAEHLRLLREKYHSDLAEIAREVPGVMGIAALDLTTEERFGVNEALVFPQGSSIKIPILIELYRQADTGRLRLDERIPVRAVDQVGGSGVLQRFGDGTSQLSLRDLAVLMIALSDNTATNLLIDRVGMERVNRTMQEIGLPSTKLQRRMIRPEESARGNENLSTPAEAAELMARIGRCELPVSAEGCAELRDILEIPKRGAFPAPIPSDIPVAWKPGGIEGVSTAWGIVALPGRPYVLAAMVNYSEGGAAQEAIRRASAVSFDYFSHLARSTPYGARVPLRVLQEADAVHRPQ